MESIKSGLSALSKYSNIRRIIIHDVARPFLASSDFTYIARLSPEIVYAQYYMPIIGGLMHTSGVFCNPVDYKEIVTPLMISSEIAHKVITHAEFEIYPILTDEQKEKHCVWIKGIYARLRKITYFSDIPSAL